MLLVSTIAAAPALIAEVFLDVFIISAINGLVLEGMAPGPRSTGEAFKQILGGL